MPKQVRFEGRVYSFPDDASESEIMETLDTASPAPKSAGTLKTKPSAFTKATSISATPRNKTASSWSGIEDSIAGTRILGGDKTIGDVANDMKDLGIGFAKGAGRTVQMIPGVTRATDSLFGLPSGSSAQAMDATNTAQQLGGYAEAAAEMVAGGGLAKGGAALLARTPLGRFASSAAKELAPAQRSLPGLTRSAEQLGAATGKKLAELPKNVMKSKILQALGLGSLGWNLFD